MYGGNTASVLLKGKSYNRGVRAHKLTMEAMLRLLWLSFTKWVLQKKKSSPESLASVDENRIYVTAVPAWNQSLKNLRKLCRVNLNNSVQK